MHHRLLLLLCALLLVDRGVLGGQFPGPSSMWSSKLDAASAAQPASVASLLIVGSENADVNTVLSVHRSNEKGSSVQGQLVFSNFATNGTKLFHTSLAELGEPASACSDAHGEARLMMLNNVNTDRYWLSANVALVCSRATVSSSGPYTQFYMLWVNQTHITVQDSHVDAGDALNGPLAFVDSASQFFPSEGLSYCIASFFSAARSTFIVKNLTATASKKEDFGPYPPPIARLLVADMAEVESGEGRIVRDVQVMVEFAYTNWALFFTSVTEIPAAAVYEVTTFVLQHDAAPIERASINISHTPSKVFGLDSTYGVTFLATPANLDGSHGDESMAGPVLNVTQLDWTYPQLSDWWLHEEVFTNSSGTLPFRVRYSQAYAADSLVLLSFCRSNAVWSAVAPDCGSGGPSAGAAAQLRTFELDSIGMWHPSDPVFVPVSSVAPSSTSRLAEADPFAVLRGEVLDMVAVRGLIFVSDGTSVFAYYFNT